MGRRRKINREQEEELIRLFKEVGREAAGDLAVQYGVSRMYPVNLASMRGIRRPRYCKGVQGAAK